MSESQVPGQALSQPQQAGEFLTFRLGGEEYGVDILCVQEIRSYEQPAQIAGAPAFLKGVLNLRGVIVPIVDLRISLGCNSAEYNTFTAVVVVNIRGRVIGMVVDAISDVLELSRDDIKPPPEQTSGAGASYVTGIGTVKVGQGECEVSRTLFLIDTEGMMSEVGLNYFR